MSSNPIAVTLSSLKPFFFQWPSIRRCASRTMVEYKTPESNKSVLELHCNGTKLVDVKTMMEWAKTMTWKGMHPIVELNRTVYQKGVTLSKQAMRAVEDRLLRNPELPQWDILIRPVSTS